MKKCLVLVFVVCSSAAFAQKFSIKGILSDTTTGGLPAATVMLLQAKDSSLVNFSSTDVNGNFEIRNVSPGNYFIRASYVGYHNYTKRITKPESGDQIDLGKIRMRSETELLGEATVTGQKSPVTVKKDTIEFNASSFATKQNATAEDLLKKMPGVEVDNDGTIRAQGETVQRVMVDGKEFFGQDPKLATRNLPADAVDKVQVYDKKSDQTVFSGIDDGQREKTINLKLKEEKRHASFGNDMVGVGTNNRVTAKASLNRFDKGNQLSFLGMGNNINEQGFSVGDFSNFAGGGGFGGGGGGGTGASINTGRQNGIVKNYAGGINTNRSYNNEKTKLNASYFYNRLDQDLRTTTAQQNISTLGTNYVDRVTPAHNLQNNHRVNLTLDQKIDSTNSIKLLSNVAFNTSDQNQRSVGTTSEIGSHNPRLLVDQTNTNHANNVTLTSSLLWRHRFAKKGRTMSLTPSFNYGNNDTDGLLNSKNTTYTPTDTTIRIVNQRNTQKTESPTFGAALSLTEPLGGRKYLELNYNFSEAINRTTRNVYDQLEGGARVDSLSTQYRSNYVYSRPGFNIRINRDKFNLSIGTAWQNTRLKGYIITKDQHIDRLFQAILPAAHFNYDFTEFKRLRVDYTSSMQEPTITQLQPVVNNTDQQNLTTGNASLKPANSHSVRSNFTLFNPSSFMNLFALINANYTSNAIVSSQTTVTPSLVRITKPVNVSYGASISGNFNVGIPVKTINSRFNVGPNYSTSRSINPISTADSTGAILSAVNNIAVTQTLGGTARYNYTLGEILIIDLSANLSHQDTKYSFNTQQNQQYFNKTYTAELNTNFLKNYAFNSELNYFVYSSKTTDFHQTIPLWNMSVSRYVLKNKAGEIKLSVNNLLDKSLSVQQTVTSSYLSQTTTNNLGRYFMISFTYALNKALNPTNGMRVRTMGGPPPGGGGGGMIFRRD